MIKIDLITGFLGTGKTTFIKAYVPYLKSLGYRIGIIENDFGAINIDRMLLNNLEDDHCLVEQVTSTNLLDYKRRLKTKLIALKMQGFNYIVVEPSGIYDVELFFDVLDDDPLHEWYELNNIIALVSSNLAKENPSYNMRYLIANQLSYAGKVVLTKTDLVSKDTINQTKECLKNIAKEFKIAKTLDNLLIDTASKDLISKNGEDLLKSSYTYSSLDHVNINLFTTFKSTFVLETKKSVEETLNIIKKMFDNSKYGSLLRVKGFIKENGHYEEINATKDEVNVSQTHDGQEVLIFIGENLNDNKIKEAFAD